MKTKDLYKEKNNCCGCELCAQSCPKSIITMSPDEEGFLYPSILDDRNCVNCKKCLIVCPIKSPGRSGRKIVNSYSYFLDDDKDLQKSASGGLATAISRVFIAKGGVVYGVRYDESFSEIIYSRASTRHELEGFRGSKYAQASKRGLYAEIKKDLKANINVLFIGLPCETAAVYHAFGEHDKLYTISLICHGPTSQKVHRDYCNSLPHSQISKLISFSVRYKQNGWKPYYIHAEYANGEVYQEPFSESDYGTAFLYLKRPSCRICKYKFGNKDFGLQADLTIGDFHGVNRKSIQYNKWGVSQGSVHTEKGEWLMSLVINDKKRSIIPFSVIRVTNRGLFMAIPQRGNKERFLCDYFNHSLHYACNSKSVKLTNIRINLWYKLLKLRAVKKIPKYLLSKIIK